MRDSQSKTPSLIFEYVNNTDFRSLYPKFVDYDVRYYIFELLKVCAEEGGGVANGRKGFQLLTNVARL